MSKEKQMNLLLGDIHGEFMNIAGQLTRYDIRDANIIQLGDFGMGFNKPGYYKQILNKLDKRLRTRNVHLYAFRGNHDDPSYFSETNNPFGCTNITLLADYSELDLIGVKFLCIGGAISIDRTWEKRIEGKSWWSNEGFVLNEDLIQSSDYDWVLTHTRPLMASPWGINTPRIKEWLNRDENLHDDLLKEAKNLNRIWELTKPQKWAYGHFHETQTYQAEGTTFTCLGIDTLYPINYAI
jgi:hypothetical protein